MARILLISSSIRGVLNSIIGLANYLKHSGFEVTIAAPESVKELVLNRGITHEAIKDKVMSPYRGSWWKKQPPKGLSRKEDIVAQMGESEFHDLIDKVNPDLLLIDIERYPYIIMSYQHKIPLALVTGWFSIWKRSGLPPLHSYIIPGQGKEGSNYSINKAWWWHWFKKWSRSKIAWFKDAGTNPMSVAKYLAKKYGFPFRSEAEPFQWLIPFSFRTLPVINMVLQEMELPHDPRPNLHYIGPMIQTDRSDAEFTNAETDSKLEEIFSLKMQKPDEVKIIYCGTSTIISTNLTLLKNVIEAGRRNPNWIIILGLGNKIKVEQLGDLPPNVYAFNWVPQLRVLDHADCCINHAGINTINECIHFKVPMIIYSGGVMDENGCAARIAYHKLGIVGNITTDDTNRVEKHIQQTLEDQTIHQSIHKMQAAYIAQKNKGIEVIQGLIADKNTVKS